MTFRSLPILCAALIFIASNASGQPSAGTPVSTDRSVQSAKSNLRINVYFEQVDAKGFVILKYGTVLLPTRLAGLKLRAGSGGVLGLVLPTGVLLQAEVIQKGTVPTIILWQGTKNLNQELLMQGVAEGVR